MLVASGPLSVAEQEGFYMFLCNGLSEYVAPADDIGLTTTSLNVLWRGDIVATYDRTRVIAASREPLMPPLFG